MVESSRPATPVEVARHYDQLDRFYREIWGDHVHHGLWRTGRETADEATRCLVDEVIQKARLTDASEVCDLGCGYGATSRILARELHLQVTGLTVSSAQQRYAQEATAPASNPQYLLEDWLNNQRASASFDALIAIESTEHMADKPKVFEEAHRVLRPGGRLVVCAWLAADQPLPWMRRVLLEPICREGRMPGLGNEGNYMQWMTEAGFTVTAADDISALVSRTWPICAWRFIKGVIRRPAYLKFLLDRRNDNRIFALTMLRLWVAYQTRAMRYVIFAAERR